MSYRDSMYLAEQLILQSKLTDELGMAQGELSFMSLRALKHVFSIKDIEWRRKLTMSYRQEMVTILARQLIAI